MNRYFKTSDAKNFAFYKVPKALFEEKYKSISTDAKMLYGLLLDRMYLSVKNNWIVKEAISELADLVRCYNSAFLYLISEKKGSESINREKSLRAKTESAKQRISDLDKLFSRIYEDNILGKLSDERYSRMASEYETEQKQLMQEVEENEKHSLNFKSKLSI